MNDTYNGTFLDLRTTGIGLSVDDWRSMLKSWRRLEEYEATSHGEESPVIMLPTVDKVIFNDPATIVYWKDGTKTVVRCQSGDAFSKETGLMAAMLKRFMGNDNTFNKVINGLLEKFA